MVDSEQNSIAIREPYPGLAIVMFRLPSTYPRHKHEDESLSGARLSHAKERASS